MGYSTHRGSDVFGIGVSAVSSIPSAFAQNSADLEEYMNKARSGQLPVHRGIIRSPEDQLRAAAIEDLLCLGAIDIAAFERTWSVSFWEHFSQCVSELQILERDSLITIEPSRLTVLPLGRLFLRNIAAVFDAYLAAHRQKQASVFSQSV
jgi:oxygen-independent coproporphyrinogen-3 oxidase